MIAIVLIALVALLAFANGSNDNGKGVATLVGFGVATPGQALVYATVATACGGALSFWLAGGLVGKFSGAWLFAAGVDLDVLFFLSVLVGACGWVLLASMTGLPVSTTHAIVGALCGAGLVSFGEASLQWSALGTRFALPLALGPLLSLVTVYVVAVPVSGIVRYVAGRCLCVVERQPEVFVAGPASVALIGSGQGQAIIVGRRGTCAADGAVGSVTAASVANAVHWLSAGLVSFARGWNDTPKIAALSLIALAGVKHGAAVGFIVVVIAMALGGLLAGRRVLETMSRKLTPLPLAESLTASLVTATLVGLASWRNLPVSTTHVATGAIIGAGLKNNPRCVRWGKVGEVVLSWIVTLPVAGLVAALAKFVIS
jgi:PiT family inorganic phosphate transporter